MLKQDEQLALQKLMNATPQNRKLIQALIDDHRFTVSQISHEIRNPLTLVYSMLQLIETSHPEVKQFRHWDEVIHDVEYMKSLLEELSSFNNSKYLNKTSFSLQHFMEHLALTFAASCSNTEIEFTSKIDLGLPDIYGDGIKLKEVFLNLLQNASEAICGKGSIYLHAFRENSSVIITIHDNGCGILPEQLTQIFTPFYTGKQGGSGLGLPIAQNVVMAHNGTIEVASGGGEGTLFTVTLPI